MFHPQRQSVTKTLHRQPRNGRGNLNTPLPAQYCDSRQGFVEPNDPVAYRGGCSTPPPKF